MTETGRKPPVFTKMVNNQTGYDIFLILCIKLIFSSVGVRNLHHCIVDLVSFFN